MIASATAEGPVSGHRHVRYPDLRPGGRGHPAQLRQHRNVGVVGGHHLIACPELELADDRLHARRRVVGEDKASGSAPRNAASLARTSSSKSGSCRTRKPAGCVPVRPASLLRGEHADRRGTEAAVIEVRKIGSSVHEDAPGRSTHFTDHPRRMLTAARRPAHSRTHLPGGTRRGFVPRLPQASPLGLNDILH